MQKITLNPVTPPAAAYRKTCPSCQSLFNLAEYTIQVCSNCGFDTANNFYTVADCKPQTQTIHEN